MSGRRPALLIVEPVLDGHHGAYMQWIIRGAMRHGFRTHWATSAACSAHPRFLAIREEFGDDLAIVEFPWGDSPEGEGGGSMRLAARELRRHGELRRLHGACRDTVRPEFILLPYLDYLTNAIGLLGSPFGSTPFGALAMRPSFHFRTMGIESGKVRFSAMRELLFSRLLDNDALKILFTIDASLKAYLDGTGRSSAAKVAFVEDPAELTGSRGREDARGRLGIAQDALVILVYGDIKAARKGLDSLLHAANTPGFPDNAHILVAGLHDDAAIRTLKAPAFAWLREAGRLHQLDAYLGNEQEWDVFAASDIVWLGYRGHDHGSGVMVQAGRMGLPVLACREGLIGRSTVEDGLGMAVRVSDPGQVVEGIRRLARELEGAVNPYRERARLRFASHSPEHFGHAVCASIQACISGGMAAATSPRGRTRR